MSRGWKRPTSVTEVSDLAVFRVMLVGVASQAIDRIGAPVIIAVAVHLFSPDILVTWKNFSLPTQYYWPAIVILLLATAGLYVVQYRLVAYQAANVSLLSQSMVRKWADRTFDKEPDRSLLKVANENCSSTIQFIISGTTIILCIAILSIFELSFVLAYAVILFSYVAVTVAKHKSAMASPLLSSSMSATAQLKHLPAESRVARLKNERFDQAVITTAIVALLCIEMKGSTNNLSLVICALSLAKLTPVVRIMLNGLRQALISWAILSKTQLQSASNVR